MEGCHIDVNFELGYTHFVCGGNKMNFIIAPSFSSRILKRCLPLEAVWAVSQSKEQTIQ
jgi:hypothetical protein